MIGIGDKPASERSDFTLIPFLRRSAPKWT